MIQYCQLRICCFDYFNFDYVCIVLYMSNKKTKRKHATIVDEIEDIEISESDSDRAKKKKRCPTHVDVS